MFQQISKLVVVSRFEVSCDVLITVTCMKEYEYSNECKVKGHNRSQERFRSFHFRHSIESGVIKSRMIENRHIKILTEVMLIYSICSVLAIRTAYDHINERSDMKKMLIYDSLGLSSGITMLERGTEAANKKTQVNIKEICMGESIQYDYGNRNEDIYNAPIPSNITTANDV